jgi:hypothetical protein
MQAAASAASLLRFARFFGVVGQIQATAAAQFLLAMSAMWTFPHQVAAEGEASR